jgi:hypothetical protein
MRTLSGNDSLERRGIRLLKGGKECVDNASIFMISFVLEEGCARRVLGGTQSGSGTRRRQGPLSEKLQGLARLLVLKAYQECVDGDTVGRRGALGGLR